MSILIAGRGVLMIVIVTIGCSAALLASQAATAPSRGAIDRGRAVFEQYSIARVQHERPELI